MPEEEGSGYINTKLLASLGGREETVGIDGEEISLVNDGAFLWGVEDKDKGRGIFNHVMLTGRTSYFIGRELKDRKVPGFEEIDIPLLVNAAILHDITKLYGEDRERLTDDQKRTLGLPENFREIMDEVDEVGVSWLRKAGYPLDVCEAITGHDFPENIVDNPYWKIVLVADYMTGQKVMTVNERLDDVKRRWIDEKIRKGERPRIEPERFENAEKNIVSVANELFAALQLSDQDFIEIYELNSVGSMQRWEDFLRKTREGKVEKAKHAVGVVERVRNRGNYGKIGYSEWRETKKD